MAEVDYCRWCSGEASDSRACTCPYDCGITGCMRSPAMPEAAAIDDGWDDEPCEHECDENCEDYQGFDIWPAETGGTPEYPAEGQAPDGK